jgi:hypothetical protein
MSPGDLGRIDRIFRQAPEVLLADILIIAALASRALRIRRDIASHRLVETRMEVLDIRIGRYKMAVLIYGNG